MQQYMTFALVAAALACLAAAAIIPLARRLARVWNRSGHQGVTNVTVTVTAGGGHD